MADRHLSGMGVQELLEAMAADRPDPAAGSAAAVTVAMAAALVGKAARLSHRHTEDAPALAARADDFRVRAVGLAEADARAVASMGAKARPASDDDGPVGSEGRRSVGDAIAVPRDIGALARDVVALAAHLRAHGNPRLRADAEAAQQLAAAAERTAAALVRSNQALHES